MNIPAAVGVPVMLIVLPAQVALTPAGKPFTPVASPSFDIPVAPVVAIVTVAIAVLIHTAGDELAAPAVLTVVTVIVPVAVTVPQPPVNGML